MADRQPAGANWEDVWIPTACDMCYNGCTIRVNRVNGVNRVKKVKRVNRVNKVKYVNRVNAVKRVKIVNGVKGGKTRSPQRSAGSAAIRPKPQALSKSPGPSLTAVLVRHSRIRALVNPGWRLHISETKPVTNGVAIEVPLNSS